MANELEKALKKLQESKSEADYNRVMEILAGHMRKGTAICLRILPLQRNCTVRRSLILLKIWIYRLTEGIIAIYGDLVEKIILYGSVARKTQSDESDIDIALLLKTGTTREMYDELIELVVDIELEMGKVNF